MDKYDVSLVLACYNEAEHFAQSVKRIINTLDKTDYTWEIIFVEDKSTDNTAKLIHQALKRYPRRNLSAVFHQKNLGRGRAVVDGFNQAKGRVVGFIDIDLEVGEWYLPKFIKAIDSGSDAAIAWRIYDFNLNSLPRWLSSKGYVVLRRIFLHLPYKDTEAGYKFYQRKKITPLLKKIIYPGWFFDTEIMAWTYRAKLKVAEIPTAFVRRLDKTSTVKLIPDTIKYLKDLIIFSIKFKHA